MFYSITKYVKLPPLTKCMSHQTSNSHLFKQYYAEKSSMLFGKFSFVQRVKKKVVWKFGILSSILYVFALTCSLCSHLQDILGPTLRTKLIHNILCQNFNLPYSNIVTKTCLTILRWWSKRQHLWPPDHICNRDCLINFMTLTSCPNSLSI